MAQTDEAAQAMARLEAALERIARCADVLPVGGVSPAPVELAGRLDALIGELHHVLEGTPAAASVPSGGETGEGTADDKPGE